MKTVAGRPDPARWLKSSEHHGKVSTAEVLRLRATSAVSRDQSVRRSAQDDDSVGEQTNRDLCVGAGANLPVS
jgi:hypothetical protein